MEPSLPHRRVVPIQLQEHRLPLLLESIGSNPDQEPLHRREGYPVYHWLQTLSGTGLVAWNGESRLLTPHCGLLLPPGIPHSYRSESEVWQTVYLTFSGSALPDLLASLLLSGPAFYRWEPQSPLTTLLSGSLELLEQRADPLGLEASQQIYRFLLALSTYARTDAASDVSRRLAQLEPLLSWMEANLEQPRIGLEDLAAAAGLSGRRLNSLFRGLFGVSPYAYLIRMRIRRAKELLLSRPGNPLRVVAQQSGFRDVSHFIATFRRLTGYTPDRFRSGPS